MIKKYINILKTLTPIGFLIVTILAYQNCSQAIKSSETFTSYNVTSFSAVDGSCGSANNGMVSTKPTENLCSTGPSLGVTGTGPWYWTCEGINGGATSPLCFASVVSTSINGTCGSANGTTSITAPESSWCIVGTPQKFSGTGPWQWTCAALNGGVDAICSTQSPTTTIDGVCGPSNGVVPFVSGGFLLPNNSYCSSGTPSWFTGNGNILGVTVAPPGAANSMAWTCAGLNGGATASCASIQLGCGTANGLLTIAPVQSGFLCLNGGGGKPSAVTMNGTATSFSWNCNGTNGTLIACSAPRITTLENGQCGSSSGWALSALPVSGINPLTMCNSGVASAVTGRGPWNWTCDGANGGTAVSCSAPILICGSANGAVITTTPTTNLCSTGAVISPVTSQPSGWSWNCSIPSSQQVIYCFASKQ